MVDMSNQPYVDFRLSWKSCQDLPTPHSLGAFTTLLGTIESFLNGDESTSSETPPLPSARGAKSEEVGDSNAIPMLPNLVLWILSVLVGVFGFRRLGRHLSD